MKRLTMTVLIFILLAGMLVTPGCDSKIDWKALAKNAVTQFVGDQMVKAFTQFENNELAIKEAVTAAITGAAWLDPYLDEVGDAFVAALVDRAYKIVFDNWAAVLDKYGYDVNGDDFRAGSWILYDVSASDFPELFDPDLYADLE